MTVRALVRFVAAVAVSMPLCASAQVSGAPTPAATTVGGKLPAAPTTTVVTPARSSAVPAAAPASAAAAAMPAAPAALPSPAPVASAVAAPAPAPSPTPAFPKAKLPPPAESVLAIKQGDYRTRITVRPGEPQPGRLVELQVDMAELRDPPDPTYGDEAPIENALMALTFSGSGNKVKLYLRPLGDTGSYGVHWTPQAKGLWTATLAPMAGPGPSSSFEIGVGVPMPASAQGQEVQTSRLVLGGRSVKRIQPLTPVMHELNERWLRLLDSADTTADAAKIEELLRSLVGRAPQAFATAGVEFDELARNAATSAGRAAHAPQIERQAAMRAVELNSCTRCHVKFRDGVVDDISRWPEVKAWVR